MILSEFYGLFQILSGTIRLDSILSETLTLCHCVRRRCPTLSNSNRLCATMPDFIRVYLALPDFIPHHITKYDCFGVCRAPCDCVGTLSHSSLVCPILSGSLRLHPFVSSASRHLFPTSGLTPIKAAPKLAETSTLFTLKTGSPSRNGGSKCRKYYH